MNTRHLKKDIKSLPSLIQHGEHRASIPSVCKIPAADPTSTAFPASRLVIDTPTRPNDVDDAGPARFPLILPFSHSLQSRDLRRGHKPVPDRLVEWTNDIPEVSSRSAPPLNVA
jgi:hypothetical protein